MERKKPKKRVAKTGKPCVVQVKMPLLVEKRGDRVYFVGKPKDKHAG